MRLICKFTSHTIEKLNKSIKQLNENIYNNNDNNNNNQKSIFYNTKFITLIISAKQPHSQ
jgi:hypothetical protein